MDNVEDVLPWFKPIRKLQMQRSSLWPRAQRKTSLRSHLKVARAENIIDFYLVK